MDLSFLINNPIVMNPITGGVAGMLAGALGVGAMIAKWWRTSKYKSAFNKGTEAAGNLAGLRLKDMADKTIKDEAIKNAVLTELDEAPENFDRGFDRGLKGFKFGTPEYEAFVKTER